MADCFRRRGRISVSPPSSTQLRQQLRDLFFRAPRAGRILCSDLGRLVGRVQLQTDESEGPAPVPGDTEADQLMQLIRAVAEAVEPTRTAARNVVARAEWALERDPDRSTQLPTRLADALQAAGSASPTVRVLGLVQQAVVLMGMSLLRTEFFAVRAAARRALLHPAPDRARAGRHAGAHAGRPRRPRLAGAARPAGGRRRGGLGDARAARVRAACECANRRAGAHGVRRQCGNPALGPAAAFELQWSLRVDLDPLVSDVARVQLRIDEVGPHSDMEPARRHRVMHDLCAAAGDAWLVLGTERAPDLTAEAPPLDIGLPTNFKHVTHIGLGTEAHRPCIGGCAI